MVITKQSEECWDVSPPPSAPLPERRQSRRNNLRNDLRKTNNNKWSTEGHLPERPEGLRTTSILPPSCLWARSWHDRTARMCRSSSISHTWWVYKKKKKLKNKKAVWLNTNLHVEQSAKQSHLLVRDVGLVAAERTADDWGGRLSWRHHKVMMFKLSSFKPTAVKKWPSLLHSWADHSENYMQMSITQRCTFTVETASKGNPHDARFNQYWSTSLHRCQSLQCHRCRHLPQISSSISMSEDTEARSSSAACRGRGVDSPMSTIFFRHLAQTLCRQPRSFGFRLRVS